MEEKLRDNGMAVVLKILVYSALCSYLVVVLFPMLWLLYTSLKTDREIFIDPFSLPALDNLQWINFSNAWTLATIFLTACC